MEDYKKRVIVERRELWAKIVNLKGFFLTDEFKELPEAEKSRLFRQHKIMDLYDDVLNERIGNF